MHIGPGCVVVLTLTCPLARLQITQVHPGGIGEALSIVYTCTHARCQSNRLVAALRNVSGETRARGTKRAHAPYGYTGPYVSLMCVPSRATLMRLRGHALSPACHGRTAMRQSVRGCY